MITKQNYELGRFMWRKIGHNDESLLGFDKLPESAKKELTKIAWELHGHAKILESLMAVKPSILSK